MCRTVFVCAVLGVGAAMFSHDAQTLARAPASLPHSAASFACL